MSETTERPAAKHEPNLSRDKAILPGQDAIFGAMYPAAIKLAAPGDVASIILEGVGQEHDRDYDTGEPLFWQDGRPRMVTVIYGQVGDGKRGAWWVRGRRADKALRDAMRRIEVRRLAYGDTVTIVRGPDDVQPPRSGKGKDIVSNTYEVTIIPAVFAAS